MLMVRTQEAPGLPFHIRRWDDGGKVIAPWLYVREFLIERGFLVCERERLHSITAGMLTLSVWNQVNAKCHLRFRSWYLCHGAEFGRNEHHQPCKWKMEAWRTDGCQLNTHYLGAHRLSKAVLGEEFDNLIFRSCLEYLKLPRLLKKYCFWTVHKCTYKTVGI